MDRHFIVGRQGPTVVIREVTPQRGTVTREMAWIMARRIAAPVDRGPKANHHGWLEVQIAALDGSTSVVPADKVRFERPAPVTATTTSSAPAAPSGPSAGKPPVDSPDNYGLHRTPEQARPQWPATDPQKGFLQTLLAERILPDSVKPEVVIEAMAQGMLSKKDASALITELKVCGRKESPVAPSEQKTHTPLPDVPAGHYAVEVDGALKFYKVDRPTEGKWAGRTFVSAQASDEYHAVRNADARRSILALIAADPIESLKRYGQEIGSCGHCHRTLTDEDSRAFGIGPVCREHLGL